MDEVERDVTDAQRELEALWSAVFGEPPFIRAQARLLAQVLVEALPPAPPYVPEDTGAAPEARDGTADAAA